MFKFFNGTEVLIPVLHIHKPLVSGYSKRRNLVQFPWSYTQQWEVGDCVGTKHGTLNTTIAKT
jgi:hypothetical protein